MASESDQVDERPTLPPLRELFPECFPGDQASFNISVDAHGDYRREHTHGPAATASPARRVQRRATFPLADASAPVASDSQLPLHHPDTSVDIGHCMDGRPPPDTIHGCPLFAHPSEITQTRRSEAITVSNEEHAVPGLSSGALIVEATAAIHAPFGNRTATSPACNAVARHIPPFILDTTRHRRVPPSTGPLVDYDGPISAGPPTPPWAEQTPVLPTHPPPWSRLVDTDSRLTMYHESSPSLSPAAPDCREPTSSEPHPRIPPRPSTGRLPTVDLRAVRGPTRAEPSIAGPSTPRTTRLPAAPPSAAAEAGPSTRSSDVPGPSVSSTSVRRAGRPKRYACSLCAKSFSRPSALKTHMISHTNAKDYACPVPGCGRCYSIKSNLTRHLRAHNPPFNLSTPAHVAPASEDGAGSVSTHGSSVGATLAGVSPVGMLREDNVQEDPPPEDSADDSVTREPTTEGTPLPERRSRRRKRPL